MNKYFVHTYHTVRSKFAVEAESHEEAMKKADELLGMATSRLEFNAIGCVNTERDVVNGASSPVAMHLQTESAEEVTGYLVDEVDDTEYERSVTYDESFRPNIGETNYAMAQRERDTVLAALRLWQLLIDGTIDAQEVPGFEELFDIANNDREPVDGLPPALTNAEIDALCERINV